MQITNRFLSIVNLLRLDRPIGILLLFYPCMFGLAISYQDYQQLIYFSGLFLVGSIIMRSAGCVINDIFDQDIDRLIARTKSRPIAAGKLKTLEAIFILCPLLILGLIILLQLNKLAILIGFIVFINVIIYPLTKRITYWPQLFLGVTFNIGVLISSAVCLDRVSNAAWIVYFGSIFWTLGYDTIYAFMDLEDDLKYNVKSSAIAIQHYKPKLILSIFYILFLISIITVIALEDNLHFNILSFSFLSLAILKTLQILWSLIIEDLASCKKNFEANNYLGIFVTLTLLSAH